MHQTPRSTAGPTDGQVQPETDSLTGLLTRGSLLGALTGEASAKPRQTFALLALDLDRFKAVNDTLGHPVGNGLLRAVGKRLRGCIRAGDLAGRLGGDEFAVLLPRLASEAEASAVAARIVEMLSRPFLIDGHSVVIGASVGIALFPTDATEPEALLRCADLALYQAKAEGRGDQCRFVPALRARAEARRQLESDLRAAIGLGQFRLHYQPQVDLTTGRIVGFEALLRWQHPERGLVGPAEFVPLAEEIGLIVPIGGWVLRTACREAAGWPDRTTCVAVNVAAPQLVRREFADQVHAALVDSGLEPGRLEVEVTETALLHDTSVARANCLALRAIGVRVSLDDFGTGYSSLTQLRDFPLDRVKIDRSFVADMATKTDNAAIVGAIAALGASLGLRTTAEGVETEGQLAALRERGCTDAQGFLFSRPVPGDEVQGLLARQAAAESDEKDRRAA